MAHNETTVAAFARIIATNYNLSSKVAVTSGRHFVMYDSAHPEVLNSIAGYAEAAGLTVKRTGTPLVEETLLIEEGGR